MTHWSNQAGGIDDMSDDQNVAASRDFETWARMFSGQPPLTFLQFVLLVQAGGVPPAGDVVIAKLLEDVTAKMAVVLALLVVSLSAAAEVLARAPWRGMAKVDRDARDEASRRQRVDALLLSELRAGNRLLVAAALDGGLSAAREVFSQMQAADAFSEAHGSPGAPGRR